MVQLQSALADYASRCGGASCVALCARFHIAMFDLAHSKRGKKESSDARKRKAEISCNDAAMLVEEVLSVAPERIVSESPGDDMDWVDSYMLAMNELSRMYADSAELSGLTSASFFMLGMAKQIRFDFRYEQDLDIATCCHYVAVSILTYIRSNLNQQDESRFYQKMLSEASPGNCVGVGRANPEPSDVSSIGDKDLRKLVRLAVEQGFVLEKLSGKNFRIYHPDFAGMVVFSPSGDPRAIKNTKAAFKRIGVVI